MKKIQILITGIFALLSLLGYIYIFGDSGFIIQSRLKKNLSSMEIQIQELEHENKNLNQKIISHPNNSRKGLKPAENNPMIKSVILKFENNIDDATNEGIKIDLEPDLLELRSLYIITMLFITLVAVTLSVYLSGNSKFTESRREQN